MARRLGNCTALAAFFALGCSNVLDYDSLEFEEATGGANQGGAGAQGGSGDAGSGGAGSCADGPALCAARHSRAWVNRAASPSK